MSVQYIIWIWFEYLAEKSCKMFFSGNKIVNDYFFWDSYMYELEYVGY